MIICLLIKNISSLICFLITYTCTSCRVILMPKTQLRCLYKNILMMMKKCITKQSAYLRFIVLKIQQNPRHLTVHERCKFCTSQIEIIKSTSIYNIIINRNTHMCVSFAHFPQENYSKRLTLTVLF